MAARLLGRDAGMPIVRQLFGATSTKHVIQAVRFGKFKVSIHGHQFKHARTLSTTLQVRGTDGKLGVEKKNDTKPPVTTAESKKAEVTPKADKKDDTLSPIPSTDLVPKQVPLKTVLAIREREAEEEYSTYREKYIPITRTSIVRHILQENMLNDEEKKIFEDFAMCLDKSIRNKYHGVLQQAKEMFDPLNPDKDTIQTRKWTKNERVDNEFWLMQRLEKIMEKANFHELPKSVLAKAMEEHEVGVGVRVSHDSSKFDVLRIWALGKTLPKEKPPLYLQAWYYMFPSQIPGPLESLYYKRIALAMRLRKDQKLVLKGFKDVPKNSIEMLMPDVKIRMTKYDKLWLGSSVTMFAISLLMKASPFLSGAQNWTLGLAGMTLAVSGTLYFRYQNRKNAYLAELFEMLYSNNIANNRGLLTLVVDRAEDESFKEALLTYTFLLANRPDAVKNKSMANMAPEELGGLTQAELKSKLEKWISSKTEVNAEFDPLEALSLLSNYGIVQQKGNKLHVVSLAAAIRSMPQRPETLLMRELEADRVEDHDDEKFT
ncbi:transmembrane protein 143-like [Mizuhopecten yessoensis]|uniref:Transmembrane protein 143 n=1 Tax=Mizuhopecten yessoensis TaxID=6573 RepID=A0A210PNE9_MIZYE|nr:transmembrane protein 143-like [Mizuhopecten yessoensis]XP_021379206.1 transmembrane protein 143-like [Mizuhopecten yessoensis]OWF38029.1 Transmembrane protein 143 [Mizuhopecten yessoensis]